ncbi:MAG: acetolactate synthase small subunit, partial [Isosphaeraceae bacterium]
MRHVLSALVQNQPGVLAQVSGMFASRGFNIDSLAVGETEAPRLSRITVVVKGDDRHLEQDGVSGQHVGLGDAGVEDGAIVPVGRADIDEEQARAGGQGGETGIGPILPLKIRDIIDFAPAGRVAAGQAPGQGVGQADVGPAQAGLEASQEA